MAKNQKEIRIAMRRGESAKLFHEKFDSEKPEIHLSPGAYPYLWIGGQHGPCYATLSGKKTLEKLAKGILEEIKSKNHRTRARQNYCPKTKN